LTLVGELKVGDAPIREFHGSADDGNPAAPCRDYFARLSAAGHDAVMTEYSGAFHSFDDIGEPARYESPEDQTTRNCRLIEENGQIINIDTGADFTYRDACVTRGYTQGYDQAATDAAHAAVKSFLTDLFLLH
jgi:dienelactone hydrolase